MQNDPFSLDRLEDIVQPEAVSWWPPAPFGYFLLGMCFIWMLYVGVVATCRWLNNAYRRQALKELASLTESTVFPTADSSHHASHNTPSISVQLISEILKRVALVSFQRERVASLSGDAWLRFLNETCDQVDFTLPPSRRIGAASFEPNEKTSKSDLDRVAEDATTWIVNHRAETSP